MLHWSEGPASPPNGTLALLEMEDGEFIIARETADGWQTVLGFPEKSMDVKRWLPLHAWDGEEGFQKSIRSALRGFAVWLIMDDQHQDMMAAWMKGSHPVHVKDCELGENWKECPACVESHNGTCKTGEELPMPGDPCSS